IHDGDVQGAIEAAQRVGTLSVLVNIAGGGVPAGRTLNRDGSPHDRLAFVNTLEMNAVATFNVARLAAAAMARNEPTGDGERGVIVNTGSIAGIEGQAGQLAYAAAQGPPCQSGCSPITFRTRRSAISSVVRPSSPPRISSLC